jgi:hypothetical protein
VLSIWQTDVIFYGIDLADYNYREFDFEDQARTRGKNLVS